MKAIIAILTTTVLVVGATTAMAAEQGSDEAPGYALSLRAAQGFGAVQAARSFGGTFASARATGAYRTHLRERGVADPATAAPGARAGSRAPLWRRAF